MTKLLGIVLPLALGAAVSPTILAVELVTLSRKTAPICRAWATAAGYALVLAGCAALALLFARSTGGSRSPSEVGAIVKLVAAGLLVAIGVRSAKKPARPPRPEHAGPHPVRRAFLFGAGVMVVNFSTIALFFPAVHAIGVSAASVPAKLASFVLLYAITLLPAVVAPLLVTLLGPRATPMLGRLSRLFAAHSRGIGAGVCFVFAALLAADGLVVLI